MDIQTGRSDSCLAPHRSQMHLPLPQSHLKPDLPSNFVDPSAFLSSSQLASHWAPVPWRLVNSFQALRTSEALASALLFFPLIETSVEWGPFSEGS